MFEINTSNNAITMVQGDTGILDLTLKNYIFQKGDKVYFTVKRNISDRKVMLQKLVIEFNESVAKIFISGSDSRIPAGEYVYDIQCCLIDGRIDTVVMPSKFVILPGITLD